MALEVLADWPVTTAAAAVIDPSGVVETFGPLTHRFRLASVTKPLAALAALVAVEEGALELDDAADEDVVPGATLRHLLAHASGYAPELPRRAAPPGTRRIYSNAGIDRMGELVAEASGMTFAEYAAAALAPLGLTATTLDGSPAKDGVSCVEDLARVAHELLVPSGLLDPTTVADLRTVQFPGLRGVLPGFGARDPNDWGLGFEIRGGKSPHWTGTANSPATYGHFGQSGTLLWIDPQARVALVALTDRDFGDWARELWPAVADAVLTAAPPDPQRARMSWGE